MLFYGDLGDAKLMYDILVREPFGNKGDNRDLSGSQEVARGKVQR